MSKRNNWQEFKAILDRHQITKLYHFTDRENIESIIINGGLYSWADCDTKGIKINRPGGSSLSRGLDLQLNLQNYVRLSFTKQHPMMYVAMNDERISNPVILEIDLEVIYDSETLFADRNATKKGAQLGREIEDFKRIHFSSVKAETHFDLDPDEQEFFQAEVLIKNSIPLHAITNIGNFGLTIPSNPTQLQSKVAYTAQITRNTPTAFIFLIDQSASMKKTTMLNGVEMSLAEAVAEIVNRQINELILRCIKANEVRNYYDIAVIGYGDEAYSGWKGDLEGRDFVSPEELKNNPYKKLTTREEKRTRKGTVVKEVEKMQWIEARCDGNWTHMDKSFKRAKSILSEWMKKYHDKDCYPPTVINITDGEYNGVEEEDMLQLANDIKSMYTNDGNVILFNIHISAYSDLSISFPVSKSELDDNWYGETLYEMSSLLPLRYNDPISAIRQDNNNDRHVAMAVNADMTTLIQLMDIGTPTNITHKK